MVNSISKSMRVMLAAIAAFALAVALFSLVGPQQAYASDDDLAAVQMTPQGIESELATQSTTNGVSYAAHVQDVGWQDYVADGKEAGTTGQSLRVEALKLKLTGDEYEGSIKYRAHVQDVGWTDWVADDAEAGTTGQSLRVEALEIKLDGDIADYYDVYYCVHAADIGWMGWTKNGEPAGTAGKSLRVEAVKVQLVAKGGAAPGDTDNAFQAEYNVTYDVHSQSLGWIKGFTDGDQAGTTGASLRLEAMRVSLGALGYDGNILYRAHIQNSGWQVWRANGEAIGTTGKSLRMEAVEIELSGDIADKFDVYYSTHCQEFGWLGWAKNGETSGTTGYGYRAEAIKIQLVTKGGAAPGDTENHCYTK